MKKRKKTKIDDNDKYNIWSLFHEEITKNRELAACQHACGEITKEQLAWKRENADYYEELSEHIVKLLNKN